MGKTISEFLLMKTRIHVGRIIFPWRLRCLSGSVSWELEWCLSHPASMRSRWSSTSWKLRRSRWLWTAAELLREELTDLRNLLSTSGEYCHYIVSPLNILSFRGKETIKPEHHERTFIFYGTLDTQPAEDSNGRSFSQILSFVCKANGGAINILDIEK